jgi:hypothetical protein
LCQALRVSPAPAPSVALQQSIGNMLQLPIFIVVILLAVAVSQSFAHRPSAAVFGVCAVAALLDIAVAAYLLRRSGTLLVSSDEITFTKRLGAGSKSPAPQQVIKRVEGSSLTFRVARNGPFGNDHTGYVLKLRDNATGQEVYAGAFGRRRVQQACQSQGWSFG